LPGDVYSAATINGLAAGAQTTVNLNGTVTGSGNFTIAIVIDLNNQVDEGPAGETNNKPQFSYSVNP
jgi:subtilase family serine protease